MTRPRTGASWPICEPGSQLLVPSRVGRLRGRGTAYFDRVAVTNGGWAGLDAGQRQTLLANALTYLDQSRDPEALEIELEGLAAFSGPALVTYGDLRPPFFKRIVDLIVAAMPAAGARLIPGTAHDPQVTHPDSYVQALEDCAAVGTSARSR